MLVNDEKLSSAAQSFKNYFYSVVRCPSVNAYYSAFVDSELNDLEVLLNFEKSDLGVLTNECGMKSLHARHLMKKIMQLKEDNLDFKQWFIHLQMREYYYETVMVESHAIFTFNMLYKAMDSYCTVQQKRTSKEAFLQLIADVKQTVPSSNKANDVEIMWLELPVNNKTSKFGEGEGECV